MALKCLIMGARGIYDQDASPSQTYCNHAAYLTIKALDKDYTQFTKGADCPPWDPNTFPENPHKSDYEGSNSLKTSNLWCDVLEYQANDESCPIKEVTAEEAQKLANMGYVVVVCWKNTKPTKSPHFATVAPDTRAYNPKQGPYIANVGVVNDYMNVTSSDSFGKRTPLRYFYNTKQNFREDYSQIREFEN